MATFGERTSREGFRLDEDVIDLMEMEVLAVEWSGLVDDGVVRASCCRKHRQQGNPGRNILCDFFSSFLSVSGSGWFDYGTGPMRGYGIMRGRGCEMGGDEFVCGELKRWVLIDDISSFGVGRKVVRKGNFNGRLEANFLAEEGQAKKKKKEITR